MLQIWLDDDWKTLQKDRFGPRWCAVEQPHGAGRRRRIIREAAVLVQGHAEGLDIGDFNGHIMNGSITVARWARGRPCWRPTAMWCAVVPTAWQDIEVVLAKLMM